MEPFAGPVSHLKPTRLPHRQGTLSDASRAESSDSDDEKLDSAKSPLYFDMNLNKAFTFSQLHVQKVR